MKILRTFLFLFYSSLILAQSKGLELKLDILKDTVEFLQPFKYCMYFSNNSTDSIETNAFPWEHYKKPWMEIKPFGELKWKKLYKSDEELGMSSVVRSIYGPMNCWFDPRHNRKIPPKTHYCQKNIYYPLWTDESHIIWKPNKNFKVRIAFFAGNKIGIIHSKPVVVYVNSSPANSGFFDVLLKGDLSTEQLFETWNYCNNPDSSAAKLATMALKYPDTYFANWITSQIMECKFTMLELNQQMDYELRMEQAKSLLHEQKILAEKLLPKGFDILSQYANNLEKWMYDLDFYENESEWIQKMREPAETICHCK